MADDDRLQRDVETIRSELRQTHDLAMRATARLEAHEDSCVEVSRRTQEKVDEVHRNVEALRQDIHQRRGEETEARRERQKLVDESTMEWRTSLKGQLDGMAKRIGAAEGWNRRVAVAVVIACIGLIGMIAGQAVKPFVGAATEAVRVIGK